MSLRDRQNEGNEGNEGNNQSACSCGAERPEGLLKTNLIRGPSIPEASMNSGVDYLS